MTRVVTALYESLPQAELALAHLNSEVGIEEGDIVDGSVAGRTRLARMNIPAEERAACERELGQGGFLLIAQVDEAHDRSRIDKLLKAIPRDGLGKSDAHKQGAGGFFDFLFGEQKAPEPAASAPMPAPAARPVSSPPHGTVGEFEGFRVEDPKAPQPAAAPAAASASAPPAAPPPEPRLGPTEGFRVEDPAEKAPDPPEPEETEQRIPIVEEELRIGKREVLRGGARVHARIEEHPVREEVELLAELTSIERRPAARRLSEQELEEGGLLRERVIEITEMREEAVVSKEAFVREELVVKKTVERRTEIIEDTVRRTRVETERLPAAEDRPAFGGFSARSRDETGGR
jgi:stress response protein YsnF